MDFNEDRFLNGEVEHPRFLVLSEKIAVPFYDEAYAIAWQALAYRDTGLELRIIDLTNYDWETNPNGIRIHKLTQYRGGFISGSNEVREYNQKI